MEGEDDRKVREGNTSHGCGASDSNLCYVLFSLDKNLLQGTQLTYWQLLVESAREGEHNALDQLAKTNIIKGEGWAWILGYV